jgi:long-subunit fatty acid transport protein
MKKLVLFTVITLALAGATMVQAGGVNRLGGIGPRAAGMSGAYIGIADDVSAFYYNPAGISQRKESYAFVGMEIMSPRFK